MPVEVEGKLVKDGDEDGEQEEPSPFLPIGTPLDISYLKLGEMLNVRPDILISPSALQGTVKVRYSLPHHTDELVLIETGRRVRHSHQPRHPCKTARSRHVRTHHRTARAGHG